MAAITETKREGKGEYKETEKLDLVALIQLICQSASGSTKAAEPRDGKSEVKDGEGICPPAAFGPPSGKELEELPTPLLWEPLHAADIEKLLLEDPEFLEASRESASFRATCLACANPYSAWRLIRMKTVKLDAFHVPARRLLALSLMRVGKISHIPAWNDLWYESDMPQRERPAQDSSFRAAGMRDPALVLFAIRRGMTIRFCQWLFTLPPRVSATYSGGLHLFHSAPRHKPSAYVLFARERGHRPGMKFVDKSSLDAAAWAALPSDEKTLFETKSANHAVTVDAENAIIRRTVDSAAFATFSDRVSVYLGMDADAIRNMVKGIKTNVSGEHGDEDEEEKTSDDDCEKTDEEERQARWELMARHMLTHTSRKLGNAKKESRRATAERFMHGQALVAAIEMLCPPTPVLGFSSGGGGGGSEKSETKTRKRARK